MLLGIALFVFTLILGLFALGVAVFLFLRGKRAWGIIIGFVAVTELCFVLVLGLVLGSNIYKNIKASYNVAVPEAHQRGFESGQPEETVNQCKAATLVNQDKKIDQVVYTDLGNGDPWNFTVTIVSPAESMSHDNALIVIAQDGQSFDIVYDKMIYSSYRLEGTRDEVVCFADSLNTKDVGYRIYVGSEAPKGWLKPSEVSGAWWTAFTTWAYTEKPVDAGEGIGGYIEPTMTGDARVISPKSGLAHGQFWLSTQEGIVVYPVVEAGWKFTVADHWQGSYWTYFFVQNNLFDRIFQTSREKVAMDHLKVIVMPYCGSNVPNTTFEGKDGDNVITAKWIAPGQPLSYDLNGQTVTLEGFSCEQLK